MFVPLRTGESCREKDLLFIQNSFIEEGVNLRILKPGDGKAVCCPFGSVFVNQYGKAESIPGESNSSRDPEFCFSRKGPILQYHDWVDQTRS